MTYRDEDLLPIPDPEPWHRDAACKGTPPGTMWPERGDTEAMQTARAICADCPVTAECLAEGLAMAHHDDIGVRGGLSQRERRQLRKSRSLARIAVCAWCRRSFNPPTPTSRYCGEECLKARKREVHAEYMRRKRAS